MIGFTKALALESATRGITVNVIAAGLLRIAVKLRKRCVQCGTVLLCFPVAQQPY